MAASHGRRCNMIQDTVIVEPMVKTVDHNMVFNKTSHDIVLKHLSLILNSNNNDDSKNNIHNGIEKLNFASCKISPNRKIIGDDYTTWIDLFKRNKTVTKKIKSGKMSTKIDMKKRGSTFTTWADLHGRKCDIDDEIGDEKTLNIQLAAFRMQLEETRRRFNEEKTRKEEEWRVKRAMILQNAFFGMGNKKEESNNIYSNMKNEPLSRSHDNITALTSIKCENTELFGSKYNKFRESFDKKGVRKTRSSVDISMHNKKEIAAMEIDNELLSLLMQQFSPFGKQEIPLAQSSDYSTSFSYSNKENGSKLHKGVPPDISVVLSQLGNGNSTDYDNSYINNVKENTMIVDNGQEMAAFVSSNSSSYDLNEFELQASKDEMPSPEKFKPQDEIQIDENDLSIMISKDENLYQIPYSTGSQMLHVDGVAAFVSSNSSSYVINESEQQASKYEMPSPEKFKPQDEIQIDENDLSFMISKDENLYQIPFSTGSQMLYVDGEVDVNQASNNTLQKLTESLPVEIVAITPAPAPAMTFVVDIDAHMGTPELTPQQIKKRERFLRQRQKNMEEEKKKKAAELEKKAAELEKKQKIEETTPKKVVKETPPRHARNVWNATSTKKLENGKMSQETSLREVVLSKVTAVSSPCASPVSTTDEPSRYSEYKGPDKYKRPTGKSNRKIMQNAITYCCLCGEVNKESKAKCLEALERSKANHFVVLFREGLKFRSVYEYYPESEIATRLYGIGPKTVNEKMVIKYFKYNSGGKEFYLLETKHLSIQVDGVMIMSNYWRK